MTADRLDFDDTDGACHRRIDLDDWDDVFVVGDVHGCFDALQRLLATLEVTADDLVVFVGDLVRKGPDSRAVVRTVSEAENMLSVRGNNEEKLLRGETELPELSAVDVEYVRSMPVVVSWDDGVVVHGGIDPRKPLGEHDVDDVQNTRSLTDDSYGRPFWWDEYAGDRRAFFGHTVLSSPVVREHAVGLDTGCVYGGDLTAYDVRNEAVVAVPLRREGLSRSDDAIVDTRERLSA
ncbi:metallophosphoesterase [Halorubellus sp. PRR65]|uniref:metallophosphoesterase n=1 Tax=Halorubellus sp. PRR65 TaxID=3098148 RepID=UPI002B25BBF6|nr:metallophosphoesterase [Halorubellus sp. PRR65]